MTDQALKAAVERAEEIAGWLERGDPGAEGSVLFSASVANEHAADLRTLLAALSSQASVMEEMAKRLEPFDAVLADVGWDEDDTDLYQTMSRENRTVPAINIGHLRQARTALSQYRTLGGE